MRAGERIMPVQGAATLQQPAQLLASLGHAPTVQFARPTRGLWGTQETKPGLSPDHAVLPGAHLWGTTAQACIPPRDVHAHVGSLRRATPRWDGSKDREHMAYS